MGATIEADLLGSARRYEQLTEAGRAENTSGNRGICGIDTFQEA